MDVFSHVFRQRHTLKSRSNETNAGTSNTTSTKFNNNSSMLINHAKFNNYTITHLRPKVENEFLEFNDRYEIILTCSSFQKNEITIKYNENDNQIKIIGFQSKKYGDKIIVNRKILRCFNLPFDICADQITSVFKHSNQLKIRIPKYKKIIDRNSDGESSCYECEESSNDQFN